MHKAVTLLNKPSREDPTHQICFVPHFSRRSLPLGASPRSIGGVVSLQDARTLCTAPFRSSLRWRGWCAKPSRAMPVPYFHSASEKAGNMCPARRPPPGCAALNSLPAEPTDLCQAPIVASNERCLRILTG